MWANTGNVRIGAGGKQNPPFLSASEYFHPIPHLEARPLSRLFFCYPLGAFLRGIKYAFFAGASVSRTALVLVHPHFTW
jgi:hypothetical protein